MSKYWVFGVQSYTCVCDKGIGCVVIYAAFLCKMITESNRHHVVCSLISLLSVAARSWSESWAKSRKNEVNWSVMIKAVSTRDSRQMFTWLAIKWPLIYQFSSWGCLSCWSQMYSLLLHWNSTFRCYSRSCQFQMSWRLGDIKQRYTHFLLYCVYIF